MFFGGYREKRLWVVVSVEVRVGCWGWILFWWGFRWYRFEVELVGFVGVGF